MHSIFLKFDNAVRIKGLFKMDTVGDAYICAGFFEADHDTPDSAEDIGLMVNIGKARVCKDLLDVAAEMLRAIDEMRWPVGAAAACRIGVSAGPVVAGALGRLQPR